MKRLLIVEDDQTFAEALASEFSDRSYEPTVYHTLKDLRAASIEADYALVDLKLRGESGLDAVALIKERCPSCEILVLTGYGSIATAVQAVKSGAMNYISKPASIADIERALRGASAEEESATPPSLHRHEREYIEKVVADHAGNISQAAKALGIHRQSLQRKLRKFT
ncbi:MAG: response regulator [Proteobacteria bacterium]|nr:MAG: response regulator [Pseudomonadota bacterium]